jgi:hypothetical protein
MAAGWTTGWTLYTKIVLGDHIVSKEPEVGSVARRFEDLVSQHKCIFKNASAITLSPQMVANLAIAFTKQLELRKTMFIHFEQERVTVQCNAKDAGPVLSARPVTIQPFPNIIISNYMSEFPVQGFNASFLPEGRYNFKEVLLVNHRWADSFSKFMKGEMPAKIVSNCEKVTYKFTGDMGGDEFKILVDINPKYLVIDTVGSFHDVNVVLQRYIAVSMTKSVEEITVITNQAKGDYTALEEFIKCLNRFANLKRLVTQTSGGLMYNIWATPPTTLTASQMATYLDPLKNTSIMMDILRGMLLNVEASSRLFTLIAETRATEMETMDIRLQAEPGKRAALIEMLGNLTKVIKKCPKLTSFKLHVRLPAGVTAPFPGPPLLDSEKITLKLFARAIWDKSVDLKVLGVQICDPELISLLGIVLICPPQSNFDHVYIVAANQDSYFSSPDELISVPRYALDETTPGEHIVYFVSNRCVYLRVDDSRGLGNMIRNYKVKSSVEYIFITRSSPPTFAYTFTDLNCFWSPNLRTFYVDHGLRAQSVDQIVRTFSGISTLTRFTADINVDDETHFGTRQTHMTNRCNPYNRTRSIVRYMRDRYPPRAIVLTIVCAKLTRVGAGSPITVLNTDLIRKLLPYLAPPDVPYQSKVVRRARGEGQATTHPDPNPYDSQGPDPPGFIPIS